MPRGVLAIVWPRTLEQGEMAYSIVKWRIVVFSYVKLISSVLLVLLGVAIPGWRLRNAGDDGRKEALPAIRVLGTVYRKWTLPILAIRCRCRSGSVVRLAPPAARFGIVILPKDGSVSTAFTFLRTGGLLTVR